MTVGFILVAVSAWFAWAVCYTPFGREVLSGIVVMSNGAAQVDYYYAPMAMLAAGLFALLPVFSRKFLKDSETLSSVLALVAGFIAMVLMVLYTGSLSDVLSSDLDAGESAKLGVGIYIAIIGCIVIVVGSILGVLNGVTVKRKHVPEPEPASANYPETAIGPVPAMPVKEVNEPIPTSTPSEEEIQEIDPQSLDTVDVIGGRPVHERPKRP